MDKLHSLRFVKTPGSMELPSGVARQFKVFAGDESLDDVPGLVFDLDKVHMRGLTRVHIGRELLWTLDCQAKTGAGIWDLKTDAGSSVGRISGRGSLKQGWKLEMPEGGATFELVSPVSIAKQAVRTMLGGDTDAMVLLKDGDLAGTLTRKHRDQAPDKKAGLLAGLKRFVTGRDWVLESQDLDFGHGIANKERLSALAALGLVAIVSLALSTAD